MERQKCIYLSKRLADSQMVHALSEHDMFSMLVNTLVEDYIDGKLYTEEDVEDLKDELEAWKTIAKNLVMVIKINEAKRVWGVESEV